MNELYFFDTYAIIEAIRGNPNYKKFRTLPIITSIFNLAELNYILKKEMTKDKADNYTEEYENALVEVAVTDIKKAMDLKTKKRNLSIPDAIGYTLAIKNKAIFVTGDSDFKEFPNVEFII